MLYRRNLQDRDVAATCSLKSSWSSRTTPRFLAEWEKVTVVPSTVTEHSCRRESLWGMNSSTVLLMLSFRWCLAIHYEMSAWHFTVIEATVKLGTLNSLEMFLYPCPDLCLATILSRMSTEFHGLHGLIFVPTCSVESSQVLDTSQG